MTDEGKRLLREERAHEAIATWQTCPLSELQGAAKVFDGALLLLIQRYAASCRINEGNPP